MTPPARASKLDPYGEKILALHREGRKLAEISKYLAHEYGLSVALSTLSEYVNRPRHSTAPPAAIPPPVTTTPAQEMLLDQVAVYAEIQASIRVLVEEVQAMRDAFPDLARLEGRFDALSRQIEAVKASPPPLSPETAPATPPPATGGEVPSPALLRRIWARALWVTGGLWLVLIALGSYWLGVWDAAAP